VNILEADYLNRQNIRYKFVLKSKFKSLQAIVFRFFPEHSTAEVDPPQTCDSYLPAQQRSGPHVLSEEIPQKLRAQHQGRACLYRGLRFNMQSSIHSNYIDLSRSDIDSDIFILRYLTM